MFLSNHNPKEKEPEEKKNLVKHESLPGWGSRKSDATFLKLSGEELRGHRDAPLHLSSTVPTVGWVGPTALGGNPQGRLWG